MTMCNLCLVRTMRIHATRTNEVVTVKPILSNLRITVGYNVFLHPRDVDPDTLVANPLDQEPGEYFAAWLAALPDHCCCNEREDPHG